MNLQPVNRVSSKMDDWKVKVELQCVLGHPTLPSMMIITSAARIYAMHLPIDESGRSFFEYDKLTSNRYTFFSSLLVKISPCMYDTSVPKWPLEVS